MKFKLIISLVCLSFHMQSTQVAYSTSFNLKKIHDTTFDIYLPDSPQLSISEKNQRMVWKEELWNYIQTKNEIIELLQRFQPSCPFLPQDIKNEFQTITQQEHNTADTERMEQFQYMLRRHPDNTIRTFATALKNLYCYFIYAGPLTSTISGYKNSPTIIKDVDCAIPPTQLCYHNGNITHKDGDIDYLIIGSGPAGSLIAHELVKQKPQCRTVLIDRGSFIKPHALSSTKFLSELMESRNMRTTIDSGIAVRNGQVFGGGTVVNLDLAFSPLLPHIKKQIQLWIDTHCIDESLIHKNHHDWQHIKNAYEYVMHHVGTRTVQLHEINTNNNILFSSLATATTYDLNAHTPGTSSCDSKISAIDAFVMPALSDGLSIIPDVKVKNIIFETHNGVSHASRVTLEFQVPLQASYSITDPNNFNVPAGTTASIQAKHIILCSGTLGSAEILLRSKVANSNIGKGIIMHPAMGIYGKFNKEINAFNGLAASVYAPAEHDTDGYFFESMSSTPTFIAMTHPGSGHQLIDLIRHTKYLGGFGVMLIDSVSQENCIFIDPHTNQVQIKYILSEDDKKRFRKGLMRGLEILFEQGSYEVHIPSCEPLLSHKPCYVPITTKQLIKKAVSKLQFIENENYISSAHMQSSNKMGNNPQTSVVSHNFKVWDQNTQQEIDNLYVCDSSIFPTSVGANPMQSIYTFAKLFIDKHITNMSCTTN